MQVIKLKITRPSKYTNSQGEEKTSWKEVGWITLFNKSQNSIPDNMLKEINGICELNISEAEFKVFPHLPDQNSQSPFPPSHTSQDVQSPEEIAASVDW